MQCCGSESAKILVGWILILPIRIQIQEGKSDLQKIETSEEISCFEEPEILFGG
jgi:hypothetical protein